MDHFVRTEALDHTEPGAISLRGFRPLLTRLFACDEVQHA
ncbi:MAG: hypothetical protein ACI8RE_003027 [Ilumatobacter sp.]|jgi:hypothetical protein